MLSMFVAGVLLGVLLGELLSVALSGDVLPFTLPEGFCVVEEGIVWSDCGLVVGAGAEVLFDMPFVVLLSGL